MTKIEQEQSDFFAPMSADMVDTLVGQYAISKGKIQKIVATITENLDVLQYFEPRGSYHSSSSFDEVVAIRSLDASYWQRALSMTDVLECMPQKRRDEWSNLIREHKTPEFNEDSVRATMADLLAMRQKFFAEKVDGVFRRLSGDHVTNRPEGFNKRMILNYVLDSFGLTSTSAAGHIDDLRAVIGKFLGYEPAIRSYELIKTLQNHWGEWVYIDGAALKIRLYKKGTAHIEIHPEMAWRLNKILAELYPAAIPASFRTPPKQKIKDFDMIQRPLPAEVLRELGSLYYHHDNKITFTGHSKASKQVMDEVTQILIGLGAEQEKPGLFICNFNIKPIIGEILLYGSMPDKKAYQFYQTPPELAVTAAEMLDIQPSDYCLEPSAGQGALAVHMPKDKTLCIELAPLRCKILKEKGFNMLEADFLKYAEQSMLCFNKVLMNPPFSEGRAMAHVKSAMELTAKGGRVVAILPASFIGKKAIESGWDYAWTPEIKNAFAGASISVTIMTANKF